MTGEAAVRWEQMYNDTPLREAPAHFRGLCSAPFLQHYLDTVLQICPPGSRTLETGVGTGYGAIWLSQRGVKAEGLDYAPRIVERARQTNNILGGSATFRCGDLFSLYADLQSCASSPSCDVAPPYRVIHHQGVLEHFTVPQIQAALAQQVALTEWVIFSVPSVHYPFEPEFGDERMLPIEEWQRILAPFHTAELRYYGDPRFGGQEHILGVLRGQTADADLLARMTVPADPYPEGISAIVHTRNEAAHIADCLASLQGCADELIVCDMESQDETLNIARRFTPHIVLHPHITNFDRARNVSAMRARFRWILYLDADERIPEGMGPFLRRYLADAGDSFAALQLPFKHHFAGRWLRCLSPGYKAPSVFKNGCFTYHARTHAGAQVDGPVARLPFDAPELALPHYAFADIGQYLQKLDRYTAAEAASMQADGRPFHWREAMRHTVHDLCAYYDGAGAGALDGVHGLHYSVLSGFYRWVQHARLYEAHSHAGSLQPTEQEVPTSVEEMLQFALDIAREERQRREASQAGSGVAAHPPPELPRESASAQAEEGARTVVSAAETVAAEVVWCGPFGSSSGYGEESRHFLFGLEETGTPVAARPNGWREDAEALTPTEAARLHTMTGRTVAPDAVWIVEDFAPRFTRPQGGGLVIGRTMFETDRIPADWVAACNRMDAVWVPSEFHRQTFLRSGVEVHRLAVIPGCFDPAPFLALKSPEGRERKQTKGKKPPPGQAKGPFTFLSVFDWTLHKGWDLLLVGFLQAFEGREDVALTLKVWSSLGYSEAQMREQAAEHVRHTLGHDLLADPRIRFVFERLASPDLIALYHAADAFVLPSRGEGWGRPLMEAMACGLPTIGTNWSGNTFFMTADNSLLLDCAVSDVPERGWREVPAYQGHRWAEPALPSLVACLRQLAEHPEQAREIGRRAQEHVVAHFSRAVVGKRIAAEIARLRSSSAALCLPASAPSLSVRWEGPFLSRHSLALVNRRICQGLSADGSVELSLIPMDRPEMGPEEEPGLAALVERSFAPLKGKAAVHVRHQFPPRFEAPEEGKLVLIQPWEYGFLPQEVFGDRLGGLPDIGMGI